MFLADRLFGFSRTLIGWANHLLPSNLEYFLYFRPIIKMPHVDIGIAFATFPKDCPEPKVLQCNMGHMESDDLDWYHTNSATMKMLNSLAKEHGSDIGFCGDIVAEFANEVPGTIRTQGSVRQLNLSAWSSVEASHKWYVGNQTHRQIVDMHHANGKKEKAVDQDKPVLASFSALLMQAEPTKAARYHVKCRGCGHMNTKSFPESRVCVKCGAPIGIPLF